MISVIFNFSDSSFDIYSVEIVIPAIQGGWEVKRECIHSAWHIIDGELIISLIAILFANSTSQWS